MILGDVTSAIVDCEHKTAPIEASGFPSIRTTDIKNGRLLLHQANRVSASTYKEWTARLEPKPGDLIMAREAPVGEVGIVPEGQRVCLGQRTVLVRPDKSKVVGRYLLYLLLTPEMRHAMISRAEGSTTPHLNMSDIRTLPIPELPPVEYQRAVAQLLGALDDKIELNRRTNETLEAIGRAVFKSWFVDSRSHNERQRTTLSSVCESILSGGTPSTVRPEYWGGDIPWLSSGETRNHFIVSTDKTITRAGVENSSTRFARSGCTVVASAGQGHTRGQTSLLMIDSYVNQSVIALTADTTLVSDLHLFFDLEKRYEQFRQISDSQSSRGSLTTKLLANLETIVPPREVIGKFDQLTRPLVERIRVTLEQNSTLASLRDMLLPKLISGKIRIRAGIPIEKKQPSSSTPSASEQFREAILIAALTRALATKEFPLGRLRYNKIAYFAHRKTEHDVMQHYLKKAAGPYSPWAKYQGPERIALQNGYVVRYKSGSREGLVAGPKIDAINTYLPRYDFSQSIGWAVNKFRYRKNDELELLTTVDFATLDLVSRSAPISVDNIKQVITDNPEWSPKLSRTIFSDVKIADAIAELRKHFPNTYGI